MKYYSLCLLLILFACNTGEKHNFSSHSYHIVSTENPSGPEWRKDAILTFYPHEKYTLIGPGGVYSEGKMGDLYLLYLPDSTTLELKKEPAKDGSPKLVQLHSENPMEILISENSTLRYGSRDLCSPERNWWRIKPEQKESHQQIEQRTVAHLDYMIDYFEIIEDSRVRTFNTKYLNIPFLLYRNSMKLPQISRMPESWKNLYYDDEDAGYAYTLLQDALHRIGEYPKDPENSTKGFAEAMKIMIANIEG